VRKAFEAMPVKSDRNDARGIAQLMRLGWFRPVHCKSMSAQETRALLPDARCRFVEIRAEPAAGAGACREDREVRTPMLALNDAELEIVMSAAAPIRPIDRDQFLRDVANELQRYPEIGVGIVGRVVSKIQREHLAPRRYAHSVGKWDR
jgi:hypothetical protein